MTDQQISYQQFLKSIPQDRSNEINRVWQTVRESVPKDYREVITPKFLTFQAENEWYVALANQKNYISLYLMPIYVYSELKAKFDAHAGKLKCGKSCINFKKAEELPLSVISEIIAAHNAADYIAKVQSVKKAGKQ
ncbi:MAG TPA: DUF1801 domain-containing protein [Blastocatellia bacterium]|nr:DUF1801 domain-containing protein [Blastocatellia bacterium]